MQQNPSTGPDSGQPGTLRQIRGWRATLASGVLTLAVLGYAMTLAGNGGVCVEASSSTDSTSPTSPAGARPVAATGDGYFPAGPVEQGWPANALLVYSGYYAGDTGAQVLADDGSEPKDAAAAGQLQRTDGGDWLAADFRPYVSHLDANGQPDDTFFDTFIFLAIGSERGRQFGGEYGQDKASLWPDWQWYMQRLFAPQRQLAALEQAAEWAAAALHQPDDWKLNVYIMIPYPSYRVTDFQRPGLAGPSLWPVKNRLDAVQAYIDQVLARWQAWQPRRLRLAGFYWMQEHLNPEVPGEEQMVPAVAQMVQRKGYKLGWIPWSGAYLATAWQKYGFDWAVTQPNLMFQDEPGLIAAAAQRGRSARMGIEIELDGRVHEPTGAHKLYDYLDGGVRYGYMGKLLAYYQDVRALAQLYQEGGPSRKMYDDVYAFAKGTYPGPTSAAIQVEGRLVDPEGRPVVNARVQLGEGAARTDARGHFQVAGGYRSGGVLLVSRPTGGGDGAGSMAGASSVGDQDLAQIGLWLVQRSQPDLGTLTLRPLRARLLLGFDTAEQVAAALGVGVSLELISKEQTTQGDGALAMQPSQTWGGPRALFVNLPELAGTPTDWSGYQALTLDVWTPPAVAGQLSISLRDESDGLYTRSYPLVATANGGWQTLVVPLEEAATGEEHTNPLGQGTKGGVDLRHLNRIAINWQPEAGADSASLTFDNLRLCL